MEPIQKSFYANGKPILGAAIANGLQPANLSHSEAEFVSSLRNYTQKNPVPKPFAFKLFRLCVKQYATKLPPVVAVTAAGQFLLESGNGRAQSGRFNFGGIKARSPQIAKYKEMRASGLKNDHPDLPCRLCLTYEEGLTHAQIAAFGNRYVKNVGNGLHQVWDYFENYPNLSSWFDRKAHLLKSTFNAAGKNYSLCLTEKTVEGCIKKICEEGYATDSGYPSKIVSIVDDYNKIAYFGNYARTSNGGFDAVDEFKETCNAEIDKMLFDPKAYKAFLKI